MAELDGPIASAVIVPKSIAASTSPRPAKRRQSSGSDSAAKRPRTSLDPDSPTTLRESPQPTKHPKEESGDKADPNADRRKNSMQEEKKRGRRLFGGLLSTLSQSTPNGQQKRRQEIEKRQQEKAKQQKAADEIRRAERLAKLKVVRQAEQIKFNEESMRIRHSNMLAMAHFLSTKTEPKLLYKPWELLPQDEERIKRQITDAEATIGREIQEFNALYPKEPTQEKASEEEKEGKVESTSKETVGEPRAESPSVPVSIPVVNTTNLPAQASQSEHGTAEKESLEEHNGEVVVENEEDTVIY